MVRTRKEVWKLGTPWNDTLLWYAKAVGELKKRPITQKTSWRYLAAMHGIEPTIWRRLGYLGLGETLPPLKEQDRYWNQCQHQTWYFLPWHRSYVASLEAIVLDAVISLKGPPDWALPYWNYSDKQNQNALKIPPAFHEKFLPGGNDENPLFVAARFGVSVVAGDVELTDRIADNDFMGIDTGAAEGVGGPKTPFSHSGEYEGLIEAKPHDLVHGDVGGRGGLMSDPRTAALDPIFWIHHANIDRLWAVWNARDAKNLNPNDAAWLNGPADRAFAIFGPDGKDVPSLPKDVLDTTAMGYNYDDISDPLGGSIRRLVRLEAFASLAGLPSTESEEEENMTMGPNVELMGASDNLVKLGGSAITAEVKLAAQPRARFEASFTRSNILATTPGEPDRVFINLENIRGENGSAVFDVYLGSKTSSANTPGAHVGSFSLFGLEEASNANGPHGGRGLTKVLEATKAFDAMHLSKELGVGSLEVRIVPRSDVRDEDAITVGQVSLYRKASQ
jgi:tyrosinase